MPMSWVGGTPTTYSSFSTVETAIIPVVHEGDGVFAFVLSTNDLYPVSGWSLILSQAIVGDDPQQLNVFQKDVVLVSDSDGTQDFEQIDAGDIAVTVAAVRGRNPCFVAESDSTSVDSTTTFTVTPPALTAGGSEIFLLVGSSQVGGDTYGSAPTGATPWTGTGAANNVRLAGAYQNRAAGEANSGDFVMSGDTPAFNNGLGAVTLRISDAIPMSIEEDTGISSDILLPGQDAGLIRELVALDPDILASWTRTITDGFRVVPLLLTTKVWAVLAEDDVTIDDPARYDYGVVLTEMLNVAPLTGVNGVYGLVTIETLRIASKLLAGQPMALTDEIAVEDVIQAVLGARIIEQLRLASTLTGNAQYGVSLVQSMRLSDTLRNFFAGDILDYVNFSSLPLPSQRIVRTLAENVALAETLAPKMLLRVMAQDDFEIQPEILLNAIYAGVIRDGIEIVAAYIEPGNSFTTWTINTLNGFTTEYTNFNFNSFAARGNTYLGAAETGLYEIVGDDDAGDDIIAKIRSGLMQFQGSHLSSFKGVYLGLRGGGEWVMKIIDSTGKETIYGVTAADMETTRVRTGKGLRARYFAYELTSTGQDFDVESIEFIPLVAKRRV